MLIHFTIYNMHMLLFIIYWYYSCIKHRNRERVHYSAWLLVKFNNFYNWYLHVFVSNTSRKCNQIDGMFVLLHFYAERIFFLCVTLFIYTHTQYVKNNSAHLAIKIKQKKEHKWILRITGTSNSGIKYWFFPLAHIKFNA